MINSALDAVVGALVVMFLGAVSGWLAGSSAFYMKRFFATCKKVRAEVYIVFATLFVCFSILVYFLAPVLMNSSLSFGATIFYVAMHFVPFVILSAYAAWCHHNYRYLRRDKIKSAMLAFTKLRSINLK